MSRALLKRRYNDAGVYFAASDLASGFLDALTTLPPITFVICGIEPTGLLAPTAMSATRSSWPSWMRASDAGAPSSQCNPCFERRLGCEHRLRTARTHRDRA